jgi:DNA (cytosine-5)-methyltransferase 1
MHKGPRGTEAVESGHVVAFSAKDYGADATEELSPTLRAGGFTNSHQNGGVMPAVAYAIQDVRGLDKKQNGKGWSDEGVSYTVDTHATQGVAAYPINTQLDLRGPDVSNTSRDGFGVGDETDPAYTLQANHAHGVAYAIQERAVCENPDAGPDGIGVRADDAAYTLEARSTPQAVASAATVRRLTPVECERLQGFPDNFTAIPWRKKGAEDCPDGPRYKALGNSMAVPVMRWIGERINLIDDYLSII